MFNQTRLGWFQIVNDLKTKNESQEDF